MDVSRYVYRSEEKSFARLLCESASNDDERIEPKLMDLCRSALDAGLPEKTNSYALRQWTRVCDTSVATRYVQSVTPKYSSSVPSPDNTPLLRPVTDSLHQDVPDLRPILMGWGGNPAICDRYSLLNGARPPVTKLTPGFVSNAVDVPFVYVGWIPVVADNYRFAVHAYQAATQLGQWREKLDTNALYHAWVSEGLFQPVLPTRCGAPPFILSPDSAALLAFFTAIDSVDLYFYRLPKAYEVVDTFTRPSQGGAFHNYAEDISYLPSRDF